MHWLIEHFKKRVIQNKDGKINWMTGEGLLWGNSKEAETNPYGQLNPEQTSMTKALGPWLQSAAMNPAQQYTGEYTAPVSSGEQTAIDRNARLSALGEKGLEPLLAGEFPEDYYQNTLYKPMLKQWQEDVQPQVEESYAGPGGYWGSARAGAVGKGYRDLMDTLAAKRSELAWNVQQNVPNAITAANSLSTTEASIQSIPRIIQQYGLDKKYTEWVRTRPESLPYIQYALNFLGLSTGTYIPAEKATLGADLAKIAAAVAMAA